MLGVLLVWFLTRWPIVHKRADSAVIIVRKDRRVAAKKVPVLKSMDTALLLVGTGEGTAGYLGDP